MAVRQILIVDGKLLAHCAYCSLAASLGRSLEKHAVSVKVLPTLLVAGRGEEGVVGRELEAFVSIGEANVVFLHVHNREAKVMCELGLLNEKDVVLTSSSGEEATSSLGFYQAHGSMASISALKYDLPNEQKYLNLTWEDAVKHWEEGEPFPIKDLVPHTSLSMGALLEPFAALDILLQGYIAIHDPDEFVKGLEGVPDKQRDKIRVNARNARDAGVLNDPIEWFKECHESFRKQQVEGREYFLEKKKGELWCFSGTVPDTEMLEESAMRYDKLLLDFANRLRRENIPCDDNELIAFLGSDALVAGRAKVRPENSKALKSICEAISQCVLSSSGDALRELDQLPQVVKKAHECLVQLHTFLEGRMALSLFKQARNALNHNDVKYLWGKVRDLQGDPRKLSLLLAGAWPALSEKALAFLDGVRKLWGFYDETFEQDADQIREVIASISRLVKGPASDEVYKEIGGHLRDLWEHAPPETRGLLSGEKFREYQFQMVAIGPSDRVESSLIEAARISSELYARIESMSEGKLPNGTVEGLLREPILWQARYRLGELMWDVAVHGGPAGKSLHEACRCLVYGRLNPLVAVLLKANLEDDAETVMAECEEWKALAPSGLASVLSQLSSFCTELKAVMSGG